MSINSFFSHNMGTPKHLTPWCENTNTASIRTSSAVSKTQRSPRISHKKHGQKRFVPSILSAERLRFTAGSTASLKMSVSTSSENRRYHTSLKLSMTSMNAASQAHIPTLVTSSKNRNCDRCCGMPSRTYHRHANVYFSCATLTNSLSKTSPPTSNEAKAR